MNRSLAHVKWLSMLAVALMLAISLSSCSSIALELTCGGGSHAAPPFPIEELLLDQSVFPEGWRTDERAFDPEERLPAEQTVLGFYMHGCAQGSLRSSHKVHRFFDGARCAALGYQKMAPVWFAPRQGWRPWSVPAELPYQSSVADRFRFACYGRDGSSVQICQAVGQYEEYIVAFDIHMDSEHPDCMSFKDLEGILIAIDERMALYLGKDME